MKSFAPSPPFPWIAHVLLAMAASAVVATVSARSLAEGGALLQTASDPHEGHDHGEAVAPDAHPPIELDVHGHHVPPPRSSSDVVLESDVLLAAPHRNASELLNTAPGVYVARPEGDATAHQIFLRGFDAAHGQDVEFTLNGFIPLNLPSHVHGQGYTDLNFILPEVVRALRVSEGVFDPRQGDFAVAGSIDTSLGVADRGYRVRSTVGSFGTSRQFGLWAPRGEAEETFGAMAVSHTEGFGMNREGNSGSGIAQLAFRGPSGFDGLVLVVGHAARSRVPGLLRRDDVEAGRVGFYDTYADPSAQDQRASIGRVLAALRFERNRSRGQSTALAAWFGYVDTRSIKNFTGYTIPSRLDATQPGEGDRNDQRNRDLGVGLRALHRTARFQPVRWFRGNAEFGASFAGHLIDQEANVVRPVTNTAWDRRLDAATAMGDLGLYADLDLRLTDSIRLRGGVRADVLGFDIDDRLGGARSVDPLLSDVPSTRNGGIGAAVGPRATLEVVPTHWLHGVVSYGEGYRSPQALQVAREGEVAFARVRSFETGLKLHPWAGALELSASGFVTLSSNDLLFEPSEGILEPIGATTRRGIAAHAVARPWPWLVASGSVTYTRATLDPGAEEHDHEHNAGHAAVHGGGEGEGGVVPYVPTLVARADVAATRPLTTAGGAPLDGRVGVGFSYLGPRPLTDGNSADAVALLDASASLRWRFVEIALDVYNVSDATYAATEMSFVSRWPSASTPSSEPVRHFAAGSPRTVMASLGLAF